MTKYAHPDVQDGYGAVIVAQAIRQTLCSQAPANYAAISTYKLAEWTMSGADFTAGNGVTGRKLTVAAKTAQNATATDSSGATQHVVLHDNSSKILFYQPPSNPQPVTSGNPVTMGSYEIDLPTPT